MQESNAQFEKLFLVPPRNGIYKSSEFMNTGIKLIKMKQLFSKKFIFSSDEFELIKLNEKEEENLLLEKYDLIFSRTSVVAAGVGKCSIIIDTVNKLTWDSNTIRIRLDKKKSNPLFYFYFFNSYLGRSLVKTLSSGVAVTTITGKGLSTLNVPNPKLELQNRVASILFNYDRLIGKNEHRIKVLERMARLIYEEWFGNSKFPGHKNVKMIDSKTDFGNIPEGWQIKKLSEFIEFVRGIEPGSKNYLETPNENTIPFLRVGDLGKRDSGIFVNKTLVKNKILNERDIAITLDGTVGIVKMGLKGAYSTGIRKILLNEGKYLPLSFIYLLLQSDKIQDTLRAHAHGSTILHASSSIDYMTFVLPKENYLKIFESVGDKLLYEILNLSKKNQNLRKTRDLLLPKLISGEIDVSDLDIKIPEIEA